MYHIIHMDHKRQICGFETAKQQKYGFKTARRKIAVKKPHAKNLRFQNRMPKKLRF